MKVNISKFFYQAIKRKTNNADVKRKTRNI